MTYTQLVLLVLIAAAVIWYIGRSRALQQAGGKAQSLQSLPSHYGTTCVMWCLIPSMLFLLGWIVLEKPIINKLVATTPAIAQLDDASERALALNTVSNIASGALTGENASEELLEAAQYQRSVENTQRLSGIGITLALFALGAFIALRRIHPERRARNEVERVLYWILLLCSTIAILTTIGILLSVLFESIRFFQKVSPIEFFTSTHWSAQTALRADQVGASGSFGAIPLFTGTLLISAIAMLIAAPIGLFSAIYLAEYASRNVRNIVKPIIEILAGIPTVVYGFFAALTVAPFIRSNAEAIGLSASSESALAAGLVMGMMLIPFVSSISDDVITAVPRSLRDGAYGLGATRSETVRNVIVPAALPGIVGGLLLAISRAIGETMIVVMAAGLAANLTANPLEAVTTVTVQIVTLLVGDQEFDSAKTLSAFALGLVLFVVTLILNVIALSVVRKYREQYD